MPVAPVSSAVPTAAPEAPEQITGGFDRLLAAQVPTAGSLPSVSLGQMVASFAGNAPKAVGAPGVTTPASLGGDPWGVVMPEGAEPLRTGAACGPGAAALEAGERYLGEPYKWGGTSAATGCDCSGFVQQVYADLGVKLPRVSVDQSRAGTPVAGLSEAQPGDLVFWRASGGRPNHIGIYAGGGQMLVFPRTGDVVRYQEISRTPDAIRRVIA